MLRRQRQSPRELADAVGWAASVLESEMQAVALAAVTVALGVAP